MLNPPKTNSGQKDVFFEAFSHLAPAQDHWKATSVVAHK
jgi:hypothetical protein